MAKLTEAELVELWKSATYEEVAGADLALAVKEAKRARASEERLVKALKGLLRGEWMTYEGNLEASGHASVDDLEFARATLKAAERDGP